MPHSRASLSTSPLDSERVEGRDWPQLIFAAPARCPAPSGCSHTFKGTTCSPHFHVVRPLENSTVWAAARVLCANGNGQLINLKAGGRLLS